MNKIIPAALLFCSLSAFAKGDKAHNDPGTFNPVIPGYFADPTLKKFGDTYYVYATTDGSGAGFGPARALAEQRPCELDSHAHELA